MPASLSNGSGILPVDFRAFQFTPLTPPAPTNGSEALDILAAACQRYAGIIFGAGSPAASASAGGVPPAPAASSAALTSLVITLASADDTLQEGVDEGYSLTIPAGAANGSLACATVYGCLRGLETFAQAVLRVPAPGGAPQSFFIAGVPLAVADAPRFPHRGLLLDTSRHFLPLPLLRTAIDGLAADKSNVLHWHISDVQAMPFASAAVPALAAGAWAPDAVYTPADMRALVAYAKFRGVRIVPELDGPAHALSWAAGIPSAVLPCPSNPYNSVLDPTQEATYTLLAAVWGEIASIFPDALLHAGGDEVDVSATSCYNTPSVHAFMAAQGMAPGDFKAVARYHLARVQALLTGGLGRRWGVWEEVLDHYGGAENCSNPTPIAPFLDPAATTVFMWFCPCWQWFNMSYVTAQGFSGVKTDDWYLDNPSPWDAMYAADPLTNAGCDYSGGWANCTCGVPTGCFNITAEEQVARVRGGEASMWGERVDEANLLPTVWPRASAVAERLWSRKEVNDPAAALPRLVDHRCRLRARGVAATPLQPDWCDGSRT